MTMRRIRLVGVVAALAMAGLLMLLGPLNTSQPVFDAWQRLSPRDLSKTPVRIVWIDDQAINQFGPWPWPRRTLANLIYEISEQQPKVIGLDLLLAEPDRYSPQSFAAANETELPDAIAGQVKAMRDTDEMLAETMGTANVVLGWAAVDVDRTDEKPKTALPDEASRFSGPLPGIRTWDDAILNIPTVDFVAQGHGLLNGAPDPDGIVRRIPLAARVKGSDKPGLSLELALQALGVEAAKPVASSTQVQALKVGSHTIAVAPDGTMALRLGTMPAGAQVSAFDVLDKAVSKGAFRDAIVLVGVSGSGTADQVTTALDRSGIGTTVQANAIDAILSGAELVRPGWAWIAEGLVTVLLVALGVRLLPRLRGRIAGPLSLLAFATVFAVSWLAYARFNLLFDPVGPTLTALAAGLAMIFLMLSASREQQRQLAQQLHEEQVAAARTAGELNAARDIQLGMLPPPATLQALDPAVDVAGFVEPARSIGGDFFDAIRIGPDRLCFLVGDVSGKGVSAALFMALSKALTRSVLLRDAADLAAAISKINEEIARDNSEHMFVTMLVALLDTKTGSLAMCSAGHERPWIVRADGSMDAIAVPGGPPLGIAPGLDYEASTQALHPGDTLIIVSDGIADAQNLEGSFFDNDRLQATLERWRPDGNLGELETTMLANVRAFEAGQNPTDDVTMLAIRYRGER